ncbi:hypothetical protein DYB32_000917 [Aphanomyces invadans]|uniref:Cyclic nucleotide-binding domain-containing protein n=1 Tax=Aphanomyces invadans TaxID=157072 RepID=A0A418B8H7_9STRA|nr:hypothetical protein DYB32_000917 [Aphanomyces invadans]
MPSLLPSTDVAVTATDDCVVSLDVNSDPSAARPHVEVSTRVRASLPLKRQLADKGTSHAASPTTRRQCMKSCREYLTRHVTRVHDRLSSRANTLMLHPYSRFRRFWDMLLAFSVIYECWLIPFTLAMSWWVPSHAIEKLHVSLDVFFISDLLLNFRTAVVVYGELIQDPRDVAMIYLKSWFLVDFISVFPTDVVVAALSPANAVSSTSTRGVKLLKYVKVYQVYALGLYYAVVMLTSMSLDVVFAADNPLCGGYRDTVNATALPSAIVPLQSTLVVLSTGYAIVGLIMNSVVIGSSVFVVESWNRAGYQFRKRIDMINHEMEFLQLPEHLRLRIKAYHQYLWTHQGSATEKVSLLQDKGMSEPLRKEIAVFMYRDMLSKIPLFQTVSDQLLGFVCLCLTTVIFLPQDKIITRGEVGKDLFIVARGCVIVLAGERMSEATMAKLALNETRQSSMQRDPSTSTRRSVPPNSKVLNASPVDRTRNSDDDDVTHGDVILWEGSFFGEIGLLMEVERTRTVVAGSICELGVLSKNDFTAVMKQFPSFAKDIKRLVAERCQDSLPRPDTTASGLPRPMQTPLKRSPSNESVASPSATPPRRRPTLALPKQHARSTRKPPSSLSRPSTLLRQKSLSTAMFSRSDQSGGTCCTKEDMEQLDAKLDRVEALLQELLARSDLA